MTGIICAAHQLFARLARKHGDYFRKLEAVRRYGIEEEGELSSRIEEPRFDFDRGRGVVWVCDIQDSSKFLNDNESAQPIEEYLPRLHWLGRTAISAAGGRFIKWTGDGFLGWFPIALQRDLGAQAAKVLRAMWHLTVINNVTRLGVDMDATLRLRHGLTMEHDALVVTVSDEHGTNLDLIGRSVVLAFRLAGMKSSFPNIVTQRRSWKKLQVMILQGSVSGDSISVRRTGVGISRANALERAACIGLQRKSTGPGARTPC